MLAEAGLTPEVGLPLFDHQVSWLWDYVWDDEPDYLIVGQEATVGFELVFPGGEKVRAEVSMALVGDEDRGYWSPKMARLERFFPFFPIGSSQWVESSAQIITSAEGWLFKSFGPLRGAMIFEGGAEERLREELLALTVAERRQTLRDGLASGLRLPKDWFAPLNI
jgi:hypothetical protein